MSPSRMGLIEKTRAGGGHHSHGAQNRRAASEGRRGRAAPHRGRRPPSRMAQSFERRRKERSDSGGCHLIQAPLPAWCLRTRTTPARSRNRCRAREKTAPRAPRRRACPCGPRLCCSGCAASAARRRGCSGGRVRWQSAPGQSRYGDAVTPQFHGQRACHANHPGLGGRVDDALALAQRGARRHVDDAALPAGAQRGQKKACTSSMGARRCSPTTSPSCAVVAVSMMPGARGARVVQQAVTLCLAAISAARSRVDVSSVRSPWYEVSCGWLQVGCT